MAHPTDPTAPVFGGPPVGGNGAPFGHAGGGSSSPPHAPALTPGQIREVLAGKFVCPFCGAVNESDQGGCPRCTMENSAASRKATKVRIGPWYVLQSRNPAAPGMKFETLLSFVRKGRVRPRSVVRGPTTHQLWRFAAQVKGLSREFGVCYSCGESITADTALCPQCNRLQDPPANPDALLETSRDASVAPAAPSSSDSSMFPEAPEPRAATAVPAAASSLAGHGSAGPRELPPAASPPAEPSLEAADADFVIPALGNLGESMAGFSIDADGGSNSMAGTSFDWARIDAPPARAAGGGANGAPGGNGNYGFNPAPARPNVARANGASPTARPGANPQRAAPAAPVAAPGPARESSDRKPKEAGEFLTAKELAAAFQLDFKPDRGPAGAAAGAPQAGAAAAAAANRRAYGSAPQPPPGFEDTAHLFDRPKPRRRRVGRFVLLVLTIGVAGAAAALYLDDDLRRQAVNWSNRTKAWMLQGTPAAAGPGGRAPAASPSSRVPSSRRPATAPVADPDPDARPSEPPASTDASDPPGNSGPPPKPDAWTAASASPAPPPPTTSQPTVAPTTPPGTSGRTTPTPTATQPARAPAGDIDTTAAVEALKLYREGMEAERRADWPGAVAKYRAMKAYPKETWTTDLLARLDFAERQTRSAK